MKSKSKMTAKSKNLIITVGAALALTVAVTGVISANKTPGDTAINETAVSSVAVNKVESYGVYIDGQYVCAVSSESDASAAFGDALSLKVESLGVGNYDNEFANDIKYIYGEYPENEILSGDELYSVLSNKNIIGVNGLPVNAELSVVSKFTVEEYVDIEYEVKNIYTDLLRDGVRQIQQQGVSGEALQVYMVTVVNGVETAKDIVSVDVITESVAEVIRIGTRSSGMSTASLSILDKPYDGIITSYFGSRWGRMHNGLDIVASGRSCKGDPCYAAASGVVKLAKAHQGFGNLVVIDHGDGIETYYAHLDAFCVKEGDVVTAGQLVGKIGATGNVTGPHLHFEVHVDSEAVNPLLFVKY